LATTDTTTTTKTTTATQLGQQILVQSQANTVTVGNFVTDVTIQPYIAPRIISFYAYNMRPNQTVHVFFDSILVDQYCAPATVPTSISDTSDYKSIQKNGNWGDPIVTDSFGQVAGQFSVPASTFKTGDRVLELCDVTSIAQGNDAITTVSSAQFTASNLNVTKETVTLTTVNPTVSVIPVKNQIVTTNTTQTIVIHPDIGTVVGSWNEPIAQGLTINTPSGEAGIYATSLDLYFKQKSQIVQNGVTVYLCETNNGYPDGSKILPFSTVHLPYSSINVSADASVLTNFPFEAPVFLNNGTEYAFVVKPDAGDPDYFVYSAVLGDVDIQTGQQVFNQPTIGTAFYGATDLQWTALQTEYIKFELHRAKFSQQVGDAYFVNQKYDNISVYNIAYANSTAGVLPGDYLFQSTNSTVTTVNTSIKGIVDYYDDVKNIIYVANSTGNFTANTYMQIHRFANTTLVTSPGPNTSTLIAYANTGALYNPLFNAFVPQFASVVPAGTTLTYGVSGTSNSYGSDSSYYPVNSGTETEFYDQERIVASRTNEVSSMGGNRSLNIHARLTTDSELISPIIDTVRNQQLVLGNKIDPISFVYEEFYSSGASKSKYISQPITLASGQDAQDLQVIVTAFRPYSSDIQVWTRFLNAEDSDIISAKTWTPMINNGASLYSNSNDPTDMREFTYTVPQYYGLLPTNGTITSTSSSTTVTGSGTKFQSELKVGWYVNMLANSTVNETSRKITAIASNTSLTIDTAFTNSWTSQPIFIVTPPTTPYLSSNDSIQLTGTVSVNTTSSTITGSGTNFNTAIKAGNIIYVNGDQQSVVFVTNSTSLVVQKPWSSTVSGANAYLITPAGLTYLNSSNNIYSTFNRFQIKIVLQSNDTSRIPILDNVRGLALQL